MCRGIYEIVRIRVKMLKEKGMTSNTFKSISGLVLMYCEKCMQMTNHKKIELPLSVHYECCKCGLECGY